MRRVFKLLFITVIGIVILSFTGVLSSTARELTVVSWGGDYQKAQRKAYFEPFQKATGIKLLEEEYNGEMAKIKAMVETKNVTWDVVQVEAPELVRGCEEGLFEIIDWSRVGGKDIFLDAAISECGVGTIVWSVILAYNADRLKEGPKSWADFWNVKNSLAGGVCEKRRSFPLK